MKITPFKRFELSSQLAIRKRPINVLASLFTTMNLYLGTVSIFASIGGEFEKAAYCILAAIIFDSLDGTVARLTKSTSEFGKELDSLCDVVSFGVAPAVLVFMEYLPVGWHLPVSARTESIVSGTGSYMAIMYVICAALRLARFNTYQAEKRDFFVGLPSPAAGGTLASFVLFLQYYEPRLATHELGSFAFVALGPMSVLLALLMISSVRYPKDRMKSFILAPRHAFLVLCITGCSIALIHWAVTRHLSIILFPLGAMYVCSGIVYTLYVNFDTGAKAEESQLEEVSEEAAEPLKIAERR